MRYCKTAFYDDIRISPFDNSPLFGTVSPYASHKLCDTTLWAVRRGGARLSVIARSANRRDVVAWADTWRIEMKCAFPGPRKLRVGVLV